MTDPIQADHRNRLWQVLVDQFDLVSLKDLAFDLGVGYWLFAYDNTPQMAQELIEFCAERRLLNQLVSVVLSRSYDEQLSALMNSLPPVLRTRKVQIRLAPDSAVSVHALTSALAHHLKMPTDLVTIVGAARSDLRLLINLPREAVDMLLAAPIERLDAHQVIRTRSFTALAARTQQTWRLIAMTAPPILVDHELYPSVDWSHAEESTLNILSHISTSFKSFSRQYIANLQTALAHLPLEQLERVIEALLVAQHGEATVYVLGGGSSAVLASHFASELDTHTNIEGGPRMRVKRLVTDQGMLAVNTDDAEHEDIFAAQLRELIQPEDVVIAMSRTGRALNVLKAVAVARKVGATTVGFTGTEGGLLAKVVDIPIIIPEGAKEQIEDAHSIIQHIICTTMRESQLIGHNPLGTSRQALSQKAAPDD